MADPNPWHRDAPQRPGPSRLFVMVAALVGVTALIAALFYAFPEVTFGEYDRGQLIYLVMLVPLIASGVFAARQFSWTTAARNIAIWAGIGAVLVIGYAYRDMFSGGYERVAGEMMPAKPRVSGNAIVLTEHDDGAYYATGEVNGTRVRFAVDTGASDIVLSPEDAARAGVDLASLNYNRETSTANGVGRRAWTTVRSLTLGPIRYENIEVSVNQAPMGISLLGMSFLRRLDSFEFKNHKLTLRAK